MGSKISRQYDASVSSHHCFVCGDMNYRLMVPSTPQPSKKKEFKKRESKITDVLSSAESKKTHEIKFKTVMSLIKEKNWSLLHEYDELTKALQSKDCLFGFQTPACNFPPTFKVRKEFGYNYNNQRIPSYTDRILYKSLSGLEDNIKCVSYSPCQMFNTSDHKPIRGVFFVKTNTCDVTSNANMNSKRNLFRRPIGVSNLSIFIYDLKCHNLEPVGINRSINPYVKFVVDPVDLLVNKVRSRRNSLSLISVVAKNASKRNTKLHIQNKANMNFTRTRTMKRDPNPNWCGGSFHIKLPGFVEHSKLIGAVMYITVMSMNKTYEDDLVGTVAINLHRFFTYKNGTLKADGVVEGVSFSDKIVRDGKIQGNIEFKISSVFNVSMKSDAEKKSSDSRMSSGRCPKCLFFRRV